MSTESPGLTYTITRSAIRGAFKQWHHEDLPEDADSDTLDHIASILNAALAQAYTNDKVQEVLDTEHPDQTTYIAKMTVPGRGVLIGVVSDTTVNGGFERRRTGTSGKILVMVCSAHSAAGRFQRGRWKSVDGKPVLGNLDPETKEQLKLRKCKVCEQWKGEAEFRQDLAGGKPRKQCKECDKLYLKEYRKSKKMEHQSESPEAGGGLTLGPALDANCQFVNDASSPFTNISLPAVQMAPSGLSVGYVSVPDCPTTLGQVWAGTTQPSKQVIDKITDLSTTKVAPVQTTTTDWTKVTTPGMLPSIVDASAVSPVDELRSLFEIETTRLKELDLATANLAGVRARIQIVLHRQAGASLAP